MISSNSSRAQKIIVGRRLGNPFARLNRPPRIPRLVSASARIIAHFLPLKSPTTATMLKTSSGSRKSNPTAAKMPIIVPISPPLKPAKPKMTDSTTIKNKNSTATRLSQARRVACQGRRGLLAAKILMGGRDGGFSMEVT